MILNNFYTYKMLTLSDDKLNAEIVLNPEHEIYKGHFPEMPITPGVCQIQMVKEILSKELKRDFKIDSAKDIKFLNMINPNETNVLNLDLKLSTLENNELKINGLMSSDGRKILKIRATLV